MKNVTTLWRLLNEQKIVIPPIQRDYAQGRRGKEQLRKTFLLQIKEHLDNKKELTLDFIYGNVENNAFHPLDGQQRLTTLWLLHWYLACRSGELANVKEILKKFTYETRISSRSFCDALCDQITTVPDPNVNIREYIKQQTWFFSEWIQDPTIEAMLRTLGGDGESKDKDNIESVFYESDLKAYLEILQEQNIITFEQMVIGSEKLPVADDLYIKMNARGKKLTNFENFKADLVYSIGSFSDLAKNIDAIWTDIIWDTVKESEGKEFKGEIDDVFFSFINRYTANCVCLNDTSIAPTTIAPKDKATKGEIANDFDTVHGAKFGDDISIVYESFNVYGKYLKPKIQNLDTIFSNLNKKEIYDGIKTYFSFIPKKGVKTELKDRIYFHAICVYLEQIAPQTEKLAPWMRIVKNLTENAGIDAVDVMINCLRVVDALGKEIFENNKAVYEAVSGWTKPSESSKLNRQLIEEIEKSQQMIAQGGDWNDKIIAAETHAFFNGSIRFLYRGGNGWADFDTKFENAKKYFPDKDSVRVDTIKAFLNVFNDFGEHRIKYTVSDSKGKDREAYFEDCYFFTTLGETLDHRHDWKNTILCEPVLQDKVHLFLMKVAPVGPKDDIYQAFLDSNIIDTICSKANNDIYRYHLTRDWAVHPDRDQNVCIYVSEQRIKMNKIIKNLLDNGTLVLSDTSNVFSGDFLWGMKIPFSYNGVSYSWEVEWGGKNCIYLLDGDKKTQWVYWDNADENFLVDALNNLKS